MSNLLIIIRNIFRQLFRQKGSLLIFIILPIAGILLSMVLFSNTSESKIKIGIADNDGGTVSAWLIEDIGRQKRFQVSLIEETDVNTSITSGKLDCALIIPQGFSAGFEKGDIRKIDMVSVQGISATGWVESYLAVFLSNVRLLVIGSEGDAGMLQDLYESYSTSPTVTEHESVKNKAAGMSITYLGIGFLIQFLLVGAGRTSTLIIKERQQKTLSRIRCAPVRSSQYISGNVFVNLVMVTFQTVIALVVLQYILKIDIGVSILEMMAVLFPLLLAGIGLAMMLTSFAKTIHHLGTMITIVVYPTCLISGCFWDVEVMPEFMQKIAMLLPQRWALDGIKSLMAGNTLNDISGNLLILFAFAVAFFAIAIYGFARNKSAHALG
jgi:ABC-2 type transport system permease protein